MKVSLRGMTIAVALAAGMVLLGVLGFRAAAESGGPEAVVFPPLEPGGGSVDPTGAEGGSTGAEGGSTGAELRDRLRAPDDVTLTPRTDEEARRVVGFAREATLAAASRLREMAHAPDVLVASNGLRALGRLGLVTATSTEARFVRDARIRVRQEAVRALGQSGDRAALDLLVELLSENDEATRDLVIQALGRIGGPQARAALEARRPHAGDQERAFIDSALRALERPRRENAGG